MREGGPSRPYISHMGPKEGSLPHTPLEDLESIEP